MYVESSRIIYARAHFFNPVVNFGIACQRRAGPKTQCQNSLPGQPPCCPFVHFDRFNFLADFVIIAFSGLKEFSRHLSFGDILIVMPDKRTYADRRETLIKAVAKRRKKLKFLALEYKGGKCELCGYNRHFGALELHHIDKKDKSFGIGEKGYTRSWEKVRAELDKCALLCANCHREVSAGVVSLPNRISLKNDCSAPV